MSLYQKLLELQKAVVGLSRDKSGNSYQYVSGDKVLSIVRPKMDELGLLLVPEVTQCEFHREDYATSKGQKSEMFCNLAINFIWIDVENGEKLEVQWASSGMNAWDKSLGSAITYAERYFLLKFFHIATDRDDVDAPKTAEEEMNDMNWEAYINSLSTVKELDDMWEQYGNQLRGNKTVLAAFNKRKKAVINGTNVQ